MLLLSRVGQYLDVKYPSNTYAVTVDSILNIPLIQVESKIVSVPF